MSRPIAEGILIAVLSLVALALLLWFIFQIRIVFLYILLAAVLTLMGRPLMYLFHGKLKMSSTLSAGLTILVFLGVLTGLLSVFIPLLFKQAESFTNMNTVEIQSFIESQLDALNQSLLQNRITVLDDFLKTDWNSRLNINVITSWFGNILSILSNFSIGSFSVLFIAFFFLKERHLFNSMLLSPVPTGLAPRVQRAITTIKDLLTRYFVGLTLQVTIMFSIYYIFLVFPGRIEADIAIFIALLCALCNIVPYLGPLIGFFVINLLSMSNLYANGYNFDHVMLNRIYWITGGYLFAQLIDNFVNQPLIYSKSVKSHPLEIFLIIIIGSLLAGIPGIVLAVPAYTVLRVILKEFFSEFRFVQSITKNL